MTETHSTKPLNRHPGEPAAPVTVETDQRLFESLEDNTVLTQLKDYTVTAHPSLLSFDIRKKGPDEGFLIAQLHTRDPVEYPPDSGEHAGGLFLSSEDVPGTIIDISPEDIKDTIALTRLLDDISASILGHDDFYRQYCNIVDEHADPALAQTQWEAVTEGRKYSYTNPDIQELANSKDTIRSYIDTPGTLRALRSAAPRDNGRPRFILGELGGLLGIKSTLSQDGNSWIRPGAQVLGASKVTENAYIKDKACLYASTAGEDVTIGGDSIIKNSMVRNQATIGGEAYITHSTIKDRASVAGDPYLSNCILSDKSKVSGHVELRYIDCEDASIIGTQDISGYNSHYDVVLCGITLSGESNIETDAEQIMIQRGSYDRLLLHDTAISGSTSIDENTIIFSADGIHCHADPVAATSLNHYSLSWNRLRKTATKQEHAISRVANHPIRHAEVPNRLCPTRVLAFSLERQSRLAKYIREEYNINRITIEPATLYDAEDTYQSPPAHHVHDNVVHRNINESPFTVRLNSSVTPVLRTREQRDDTLSLIFQTTDIDHNKELFNDIRVIDLPADKVNFQDINQEIFLTDKDNKHFTILNTSFLDNPSGHLERIFEPKAEHEQMTLNQYLGTEKRFTKEPDYNPALEL